MRLAVAALSTWVLLAAPGQAQVSSDMVAACRNAVPNAALATCQPVLDSPYASSIQLAVAHGSIADAYDRLGQTNLALQQYAKGIDQINSIGGSPLGLLSSRVRIYKRLQQHQAALADYDALLQLAPNYDVYLVERGLVLLALERFDEAELAFIAALNAPPSGASVENSALRGLMKIDEQRQLEAFIVADAEREARRAAEFQEELDRAKRKGRSEALGRVLAGGVVAAAGGDNRQIGQALSGQEVTASPPRVQQAPQRRQQQTASTRTQTYEAQAAPTPAGTQSTNDTSTHNQCVRPITEESGFGSFENGCDYSVELVFCVLSPKESAWSSAFDCDKQNIGMLTVPSLKRAAAHVKGGAGVYWLACRKPAIPSKSVFEPGKGIIAQCK